jgi:hypothetical protein
MFGQLLPLKDVCKILVSFELIRNFKVSRFSMAKVIKVNIAVTYILVLSLLQPQNGKGKATNFCLIQFSAKYLGNVYRDIG